MAKILQPGYNNAIPFPPNHRKSVDARKSVKPNGDHAEA